MPVTPWTDQHTKDLIRALVQNALISRQAIYATPELAEVKENGGDRINKKLQSVLKKMVEASGVEGMGMVVGDEVAKLGRGKKGAEGMGTPSPKKGKGAKGMKEGGGGGEGSPTKKRKVKKEVEEEEAEMEEMEEEEGMDGGLVKEETD